MDEMKNGLNRQSQFHFGGNACLMFVFISVHNNQFKSQMPIKIDRD